jgi:hypothetical protein
MMMVDTVERSETVVMIDTIYIIYTVYTVCMKRVSPQGGEAVYDLSTIVTHTVERNEVE